MSFFGLMLVFSLGTIDQRVDIQGLAWSAILEPDTTIFHFMDEKEWSIVNPPHFEIKFPDSISYELWFQDDEKSFEMQNQDNLAVARLVDFMIELTELKNSRVDSLLAKYGIVVYK